MLVVGAQFLEGSGGWVKGVEGLVGVAPFDVVAHGGCVLSRVGSGVGHRVLRAAGASRCEAGLLDAVMPQVSAVVVAG